MAQHLRGKGIGAKPYHRGIPCVLGGCHPILSLIRWLCRAKTLDRTLKEWEDEDTGTDVVCATVAFGLGYASLSSPLDCLNCA
jgi:superfamily II DNA helicase RecQ